MGIQVNTGAGAVNWENVLSKLGDVQKTTNAEGKEMFSVTMQSGGVEGTYNIRVPDDLELPTTIDSTALDSLMAKIADLNLEMTPEQLEAFKTAVEEAYSKASSAVNTIATSDTKGTRSIMFDLYALMALLVEVSQSQRDAMREMRQAQNSQIQKAIQDQADQQRAAAMIGLIVGVTCGAVSAIASGAMMAGQMKGFQQQMKASQASGLQGVTTKLNTLTQADSVPHANEQLAKTQLEVGGEISNRVTADFDAKLIDPESGNLRQNFTAAKTKLETANAKVDTAQTELSQKQTVLDQKVEIRDARQATFDLKKNELGIDAKQQAYDNAVQSGDQNQIDAAKNELDQAKASLQPFEDRLNTAKADVTTAQNDVNLKQNAVANAKQEVATAKAEFDTARSDYSKTAEGIADEYQAKYEAALQRRENPPQGADKAQLDADVNTALKEMKMARAYQARLIAEEGVMTPGEHQTAVKAAKIEAEAANARVTQSQDFKMAEQRIQKFVGLNGIVMAIGSTLQGMTQSIAALKTAEATRTQAENQEAQEALDQTKDLFNNAQKLIEAIVQLMHAVVQTESQSIRDAIQA